MTGRHSSNRAPNDHADNNSTPETAVSATHRSEWRRWVIETVSVGTASVVPLGSLVETIAEREADEIDRSTIRRVLTEQILPTLESEPSIEYDRDRQLVVNYGH